MLPRVLALQSRGSFSGVWFNNVRVILRAFGVTAFLIFVMLLTGIFLQATIPALQPVPMLVTRSNWNETVAWTTIGKDEGRQHSSKTTTAIYANLTIEHLIANIRFTGRKVVRDDDVASAAETHEERAQREKSEEDDLHRRRREHEDLDFIDDDEYGGLCRSTYGGVHIWELALLSDASYCNTDACVDGILDFMRDFMDADWVRVLTESHAKPIPEHASTVDTPETAPPFDSTMPAPSGTSHMSWRGFLELHSEKHNITIISIRGTDPTSFLDFMQDVDLFFDVALYHTITTFVPGTSLLPSSLATDFMYVTTLIERLSPFDTWQRIQTKNPKSRAAPAGASEKAKPRATSTGGDKTDATEVDKDDTDEPLVTPIQRHYFKTVYDHVVERGLIHPKAKGVSDTTAEDLKKSKELRPKRLLFTGHSLGGYISHILGASTNRRAVAFSSPGVVLSRKKYGASLKDVHSTAVNVIPSHDFFPYLGWQGGQLHHVDCFASTRELCHAIEFTIVTLWNSCRSIRDRYPNVLNVSSLD